MDPENKYARWTAILDDLYARADELKQSKHMPGNKDNKELENWGSPHVDRLKAKIGDSKITLREYYRLIGAWYSLKKVQSRQVLTSISAKFNLRSNNRYVWISKDSILM